MVNPFTTGEIEFFAEDVPINVVPRFNLQTMHFISGDFGPFEAQVPAEVPLWLAISLKRRRKCNVQCPEWLQWTNLHKVKQAEKESAAGSLQALPNHYMEIASLLLQYASDDIEKSDRVRSLVEDIENLREHKVQSGLQTVGATVVQNKMAMFQLKLNNASAMEVHAIRDVLIGALETFHQLFKTEADAVEARGRVHGRASAARRAAAANASSSAFSPRFDDQLGRKSLRRHRSRQPLVESQQTLTQDSQSQYY